MAKGIKALNLRFQEEMFVKLKAEKDKTGLIWEEWILRISGIADE